MNAWQATVQGLKAEGVKYVFGLPGDPANLYFALYDSPGVTPVLVREESSAVFMAMAYARVSGEPGVVFASPGPGMANLVPALLEAHTGCSPVVAISSAASTQYVGMGAFQEADQLSMARPVTKWAFRLDRPEKLPWLLRRAFQIALSGKPGPVYVEIPSDIGQVEAEIPPYRKAERELRTAPDPARLGEAVELILKAERPLLVAGGGAALSGAGNETRSLVDLLGIPVLTTPCGRGIISEEHPLALGQVGLYFTRVGRQAYAEADLLITVGSRNEEFQSGAFRFFPRGAKYVQIDIDPFEIGRNWLPDVALVGDARLTLRQLVSVLEPRVCSQPPPRPWADRLAEEKRRLLAEVADEVQTDAVPIKSKRVVWEANQVFGRDTILVNENGSQDLWSYYSPYYRVLDNSDCVAPAEQTCMGFGVAGAIGAKLAAPHKKVICTTGDGAFQMFAKELATAAELNAGVTWLVLNNQSLGWVKYLQKLGGERYLSTDYRVSVDFARVAEASGCYGEKVEQPAQIRPALERALRVNEEGQPAVLDFIVDGCDFSEQFLRYNDMVAAGTISK
mgnify:CR=1 FL=1